MNMRIINSIWFCPQNTTVGIVIIEDKFTKESKAYIGIGNGIDQAEDELIIAKNGVPFPIDLLNMIY